MVSTFQPTALSICSGIGMLDRGWQAVTAGRTVGYCEREAFSAAVLLDRMEESALEPAPVWCGNLEDMDPAPFLGVDWVLAGIPCQPWSLAGKQLGTEDERHLGHELVRLVREVEPEFVFVENVPGFVQLGLPGLLGDLAESGFDAEWLCVKASDVGAPHKRERVFVLAHANRQRLREQRGRAEPRAEASLAGVDGSVGAVADAQGIGRRQGRPESAGIEGRPDPAECSGEVAHANSGGCQGQRERSLLNGERQALGHNADGCGANWWAGRTLPEPTIRRGSDGSAFRVDRLRALGNSVVWQQAAYALNELMNRLQPPAQADTRGD